MRAAFGGWPTRRFYAYGLSEVYAPCRAVGMAVALKLIEARATPTGAAPFAFQGCGVWVLSRLQDGTKARS